MHCPQCGYDMADKEVCRRCGFVLDVGCGCGRLEAELELVKISLIMTRLGMRPNF